MGMVLEFSARNLKSPAICACCGSAMAGDAAVFTVDSGELPLAWCDACAMHLAVRRPIGCLGMLFVTLTVGLGYLLFVGRVRAYRGHMKTLRGPACTTDARGGAAVLLPQKGSRVQIHFNGERLALAFLGANITKAVNVDFETLERARAESTRLAEIRKSGRLVLQATLENS